MEGPLIVAPGQEEGDDDDPECRLKQEADAKEKQGRTRTQRHNSGHATNECLRSRKGVYEACVKVNERERIDMR
jgi:hypothetical protein